MMLTLQFLVTGLLTGGIYALVAVSMVLLYKSTRIFNFAVGELLTFGAFVFYSFAVWCELSVVPALLWALIVAVLIGALIERLVIRPLLNQPVLSIIMATLALSSILKGLMLIIWSAYPRSLPKDMLPGKTLSIGPIVISNELLWGLIIALISFVILAYFFWKTRTGLRMRAVSEDHEVSMSCGINIVFVFIVAWVIVAILGVLSGLLVGNRVSLAVGITPYIGLKAFPAVLFGGLESIVGALVGGLFIGVIESLVGGLIYPPLGEIVAYLLLLVVLVFRPEGLFGLKRIERV
jgi:branched-chain amino acid transport system permease protein